MAAIIAVETGRFPYRVTADDALKFILKNTPDVEGVEGFISKLYTQGCVDARNLAIADFLPEGGSGAVPSPAEPSANGEIDLKAPAVASTEYPSSNEFKKVPILNAMGQPQQNGIFFPNESKGREIPVETRLAVAREVATPLVLEVARKAMESARVRPEDVGQVVLVTNTTFSGPGLDYEVVMQLGLPRNVARACVNYMGCAAGATGLRWAADFVQSNKTKVSLLVACETSSLHTNLNSSKNDIITHSLFGDGVAAAVIAAPDAPLGESPVADKWSKRISKNSFGAHCEGPLPLWICGFESRLLPETRYGITLATAHAGIECHLERDLPRYIIEGTKIWSDTLFRKNGITKKDIGFWTIHPGGSRIIDSTVEGIGLDPKVADCSWAVLREFGNVLSCGIFYTLRNMLDKKVIAPGSLGCAMSFAPGVSVEGMILKASGRPANLNVVAYNPEKPWHIQAPFGSFDVAEKMAAVDVREDDIVVCTYPKAGTTWVLQIVRLLLQDPNTPLNKAVAWFERDSVEVLKALPTGSPRIIKTHFLNSQLPKGMKRVYVTRNPKDLAVSYFHHARGKEDFGFMGDWNDFFGLYVDGTTIEGGDWWNHTKDAMLDVGKDENLLFLWYEDMKKDPVAAVTAIAKFLNLERSEEFLEAVAQGSSLESMKSDANANVEWSKARKGESAHLREGAAGGWRKMFTPAQERLLEQKWAQPCAEFGVTIPQEPIDVVDTIWH
eukprot:jgi/Mesen1/9713/ME000693S09270